MTNGSHLIIISSNMPVHESRIFENRTWFFFLNEAEMGIPGTLLCTERTCKWVPHKARADQTVWQHNHTTVQLLIHNKIISFTQIMVWPDRQVKTTHESAVLKLRPNINQRVKPSKLHKMLLNHPWSKLLSWCVRVCAKTTYAIMCHLFQSENRY